MKGTYKGCEIEVTREKCLGGWDMIFYSIFDEGYEVKSGYYDTEDSVKTIYNDMKLTVDDYREHPEDYE